MNGEEGGRRAPRTRPLFPLMAHQRGRQGVGLKFPLALFKTFVLRKHLLWEGPLNVDLENEMEQNPLKHPA